MNYYLLAGILLLTSCTPNKQETVNTISSTVDSVQMNTGEKTLLTEQPAKTVVDFLKWYRENVNRVGNINLVNNNGVGDSTKLYSVNFTAAGKYLQEINASGFVSQQYLNSQREYFKGCDAHFKNNPSYDGPPEGFDSDLIMYSQDFEEDLKNVDNLNATLIMLNDSSASVFIEPSSGGKLKYTLSKTNDKWLIDKIDPV